MLIGLIFAGIAVVLLLAGWLYTAVRADHLREDNRALVVDRDHWRGMYESLRQQFNEADDAHVKTMLERDKLQGQLAERDAQLATMDTANNALFDEKLEMELKLKKANEYIAKLMEENLNLSKDIKRLQLENSRLQGELESAQVVPAAPKPRTKGKTQ